MSRSSSVTSKRLKVLILKPSSLGDVIHALPVLRVLKQHYSHAEVHWWIDEKLAPLLEGDPDLAKIQMFRRSNWFSPRKILGELRLVIELRNESFDWVIDLQGLARSALFGWLVCGRRTVGIDSGREGARAFYDLSVRRDKAKAHAVEWYLDVVRAMGVDASVNYEWLPKRQIFLNSPLNAKAKWVIFCPGARWANKRWSAYSFARLAINLQSRNAHLRFAILGSSEDLGFSRIITEAAPGCCLNLVGKTTLPEMVHCMRLARVVVANDSGLLHVAAALNKPLVALYGPTHSGHTGPYGRPNAVIRAAMPCSPCQVPYCANVTERECMEAISPDVVADAVLAKL